MPSEHEAEARRIAPIQSYGTSMAKEIERALLSAERRGIESMRPFAAHLSLCATRYTLACPCGWFGGGSGNWPCPKCKKWHTFSGSFPPQPCNCGLRSLLSPAAPSPEAEAGTCDACHGKGEILAPCPPDCADGDKDYPCDMGHKRNCPSPSCRADRRTP